MYTCFKGLFTWWESNSSTRITLPGGSVLHLVYMHHRREVWRSERLPSRQLKWRTNVNTQFGCVSSVCWCSSSTSSFSWFTSSALLLVSLEPNISGVEHRTWSLTSKSLSFGNENRNCWPLDFPRDAAILLLKTLATELSPARPFTWQNACKT